MGFHFGGDNAYTYEIKSSLFVRENVRFLQKARIIKIYLISFWMKNAAILFLLLEHMITRNMGLHFSKKCKTEVIISNQQDKLQVAVLFQIMFEFPIQII